MAATTGSALGTDDGRWLGGRLRSRCPLVLDRSAEQGGQPTAAPLAALGPGRGVEVGRQGRDDGGQPPAEPALDLGVVAILVGETGSIGRFGGLVVHRTTEAGQGVGHPPTVRTGADRVGDPMANEPDDELVVVVPAAHQAGVWANDAIVNSSDHEVTVDLLRVDHSVEPNVGTVVARVAMSPKLLRQLIDDLSVAWDAYVDEITDRLIDAPSDTGPVPPAAGIE